MANDMTSTAPGMVQCPVCFRDFQATTINGHLDACLQESTAAASGQCVEPTELEPPLKKPRGSAQPDSALANVNKPEARSSSMAGSSAAVFSLFQNNKSKVPVPSDKSGFVSSTQTAAVAANKGLKRHLPIDVEPGLAGSAAQMSRPNQDTSKASQGSSRRGLLALNKPLADTLRPNTLEEYFGQNKVIGQQTLFRSLLESQEIPSLVLWGPPGCGKVGDAPQCTISLSLSRFFSCFLQNTWSIILTTPKQTKIDNYSIVSS